jgi:superfamily II DNA or RNA helicase
MHMTSNALAPLLTPHGRLLLTASDEAPVLPAEVARRLREAFARGSGEGLLQLGASEVGTHLPPVLAYWRELGSLYVHAVCTQADTLEPEAAWRMPEAPERELKDLAAAAPPMTGAEYVEVSVLEALWEAVDAALRQRIAVARQPVQDVLKGLNPAWNLVGRVHFNLAENRRDEDAPFAFLATYTTRLSAHSKPQHVPLGQALREYAGAQNKDKLLSLLLPVQRATDRCAWLKQMVETGEIFHPLRWKSVEAFRFLESIPELEGSGIVVRAPGAWRAHRPPRPQVSATVGGRAPSAFGMAALLDFEMSVTLDGERLTAEEVRKLLASSRGLALLRGRWVEVDPERLRRMLDQFREVEQTAQRGGVTFAEAMRLLSGAADTQTTEDDEAPDWSQVVAGPWLAETLRGLRSPEGLARVEPGPELTATLRPYQQVGLRWLYLLSRLGLGACLADDMGLGKTVQVLALLLAQQREKAPGPRTSLIVAPASLLSNWMSEIERFTPSLKAFVAHPSAIRTAELKELDPKQLKDVDLVITSYGTLLRVPWLTKTSWRLAVLDEAQAIKNPAAKQTASAKRLKAQARIALTGTPVENRLGDLWSIFDFVNPGLLGSSKDFTLFTKRLAQREHNPYAPLRSLVRPYILRRLKTDKSIIADLPDKTEVRAYCQLSRKQAALYEESVQELAEQVTAADGIRRRGIVLAFLTRFKQICNHPSHWLGDGAWAEDESGKFKRLREIAEVISARQEKVLLFTQFREATAPLATFLGSIFGRPGLVLHGETPVKKRRELVRQFQEDEDAPFFVLSLKAGGLGLNLTAASHVVHFDRWWNPAVENQATDRAFRIGQHKNVLVHKFVCKGTVEQKIDELIESKQGLAKDLLEGGGELLLTELRDEELLKLVALDLRAAGQEA